MKLIVSGCGGTMGKVLTQMIQEQTDCQLAAGFDPREESSQSFPVFHRWEDWNGSCDGVIDFSHPDNLDGLLRFVGTNKVPAVIATTGFTQQQIDRIHKASLEVPVFFSANMSLGVSLMRELCVKAAKVLGGQYDVELVEKHHHMKVDAPSGTALMLADAVSEALPYQPRYVYDRHSVRAKRDPHEIGIHSVRGGTLVGEHEMIFAGEDEVITITHTAYSKKIFAQGAINASRFLQGKKPGLYTMADLVEQA